MAAEARVTALEEEIKTLKSEAEAKELQAEHQARGVEQRYNALCTELSQVKAQRSLQSKTLEEANAAAAGVKAELHALQTEKTGGDAERARIQREVQELKHDKRDLEERLQQRTAEIAEKNTTIKAYGEKIRALAEERAEGEGRISDAERAKRAAQSSLDRVEQENKLTKQHNTFLEEELRSKSEALLQATKVSADEALQLKQDLATAERRAQQAEDKIDALTTSNDSAEAKLKEADELIKTLKQDASRQEDHYQNEISTAQRLSELYKEKADERASKVTQVEGVCEALRNHLEECKKAHEEALSSTKAATEAAEAQAAEYKARLDRATAAAAAGNLGSPATPAAATSSPLQVTPPPSGLTVTAAYSKYAEAADALRQEQHEKRRIQNYLNEILLELEKKAPIIQEQRVQYEQVMEELELTKARLEDAHVEKRNLISQCAQFERDGETSRREISRLNQQISDLSRQVAVLVHEVQQQASAVQLGDVSAGTPGAKRLAASPVQDSAAVISEQLLEFRTVQELQLQNQKLLAVTRELTEDSENNLVVAKQQAREELEAYKQQTEQKLEEVKTRRKEAEELMQTIVRQRDMYKLMAANGEVPSKASPAPGPALSTPAATAAEPAQPAPGVDYRAMLQDKEHELEMHKTEAAENRRLQQDQLQALRKELQSSAQMCSLARADAEFHADRYQRLLDTSTVQRRELETHVQRSAEQSAAIVQHQHTLAEVSQAKNVALEEVRVSTRRMADLEARCAAAEAGMERVHNEMKEVAEERTRLRSSLQALEYQKALDESSRSATSERLAAENLRLNKEWAVAQEELEKERTSKREALQAADLKLQEERKKVDESKDAMKAAEVSKLQAEKAAEVADARLKAVENSLAKAEEQVALALTGGDAAAQGQAAAGASGAAEGEGSITKERERELLAKAVAAQNEAAAAQEEAVAAAGHTAQYKAIADEHEQCLKQLEEHHSKLKAQSDEAAAKFATDMAEMKEKLKAAEEDAEESRAKLTSSEKDQISKTEEAITQKEEMSRKVEELNLELGAMKTREQQLQADVETHHTQWRSAQQAYNQSVMQHAEDIKRMNKAEKDAEEAAEAKQAALLAAEEAKATLSTVQAQAKAQKAAAEEAQRTFEASHNELVRQNKLLHSQLELQAKKASQVAAGGAGAAEAGSSAGEAGEGLAGVVSYLRLENETLECNLQLAKQEAARLQQQAEHAKRALEEARAKLAADAAAREVSVQQEEQHKKLMDDVTHLNLLRESNESLRKEKEKQLAMAREWQQKAAKAQEEQEPLKEQIRILKAAAAGHVAALTSSQAEATRWHERADELMGKYKSVDMGEHERVKAAAAESETKRQELEAQLAELQKTSKLDKSQLNIARRDIFHVYNPGKLTPSAWKAEQEQMKKQHAEFEAAAKVAKTSLTALQEEMAKTKAEKDKLQQEVAVKTKEAVTTKEEATKQAAKAEQEKKQLHLQKEALQTQLMKHKQSVAAATTTSEEVASLQTQLEAAIKEKDGIKNQVKPLMAKLQVAKQKCDERDAIIKELGGTVPTATANAAAAGGITTPPPAGAPPLVSSLSPAATSFQPPATTNAAAASTAVPMDAAATAAPLSTTAAKPAPAEADSVNAALQAKEMERAKLEEQLRQRLLQKRKAPEPAPTPVAEEPSEPVAPAPETAENAKRLRSDEAASEAQVAPEALAPAVTADKEMKYEPSAAESASAEVPAIATATATATAPEEESKVDATAAPSEEPLVEAEPAAEAEAIAPEADVAEGGGENDMSEAVGTVDDVAVAEDDVDVEEAGGEGEMQEAQEVEGAAAATTDAAEAQSSAEPMATTTRAAAATPAASATGTPAAVPKPRPAGRMISLAPSKPGAPVGAAAEPEAPQPATEAARGKPTPVRTKSGGLAAKKAAEKSLTPVQRRAQTGVQGLGPRGGVQGGRGKTTKGGAKGGKGEAGAGQKGGKTPKKGNDGAGQGGAGGAAA